jgi:hypothetical protein
MQSTNKYIIILCCKILNMITNLCNKINKFLNKNKPKGSNCSISGNDYEKKVYGVLKNILYKGKKITNQQKSDLGGSSSKNDLECIFNNKIIGIEIKKYNTPDWMQCSLKHTDGKWVGSSRGKIPLSSRIIFNNLLDDTILFNNKIPPFITGKYTHEEWKSIKKKTSIWDDSYINIPNDTIKNIYKAKGCYYIQISKFGLYHLGDDIYNFNVPEFIVDQQIRIRTKIHTRKNKHGYCSLSVIAACQPKNIKQLQISSYSLDDLKKLPKCLSVV